MVKILVAHASRMGATAEIAERIGEQLGRAGHDVDVWACADAPAADGYDALVLGSALYLGRWLQPAVQYLRSQAEPLSRRPTWLFQSGPCGAGFDLAAVRVPRKVARLSDRIGSLPPTTFGGRLDRARTTTWLGRWMATGDLSGDYRDWDLIRRWTEAILVQLADGYGGAPDPLSQPSARTIDMEAASWCWSRLGVEGEGILSYETSRGSTALAVPYVATGQQITIPLASFNEPGWRAVGAETCLEVIGHTPDDQRWVVRATGQAERIPPSEPSALEHSQRLHPANRIDSAAAEPSDQLLLRTPRVLGYYEPTSLD